MLGLLGAGLADLLLQALADIAHTLVLIRIGLAQRTHIRSYLTYLLTIDTADGQPGLLGVDRHFNARRQRKLDRVGEAQGKDDNTLAP